MVPIRTHRATIRAPGRGGEGLAGRPPGNRLLNPSRYARAPIDEVIA